MAKKTQYKEKVEKKFASFYHRTSNEKLIGNRGVEEFVFICGKIIYQEKKEKF